MTHDCPDGDEQLYKTPPDDTTRVVWDPAVLELAWINFWEPIVKFSEISKLGVKPDIIKNQVVYTYN